MFKKIVEFFTGKQPEAQPTAPYKVEAPAAPVVVAETAPAAAITAKPKAAKKPAGAKKAAAPKKPAAAKKPKAPKSK